VFEAIRNDTQKRVVGAGKEQPVTHADASMSERDFTLNHNKPTSTHSKYDT